MLSDEIYIKWRDIRMSVGGENKLWEATASDGGIERPAE